MTKQRKVLQVFYQYQHVLKVWDKFEKETMKNYDLYLKCNFLLLADVFEK